MQREKEREKVGDLREAVRNCQRGCAPQEKGGRSRQVRTGEVRVGGLLHVWPPRRQAAEAKFSPHSQPAVAEGDTTDAEACNIGTY